MDRERNIEIRRTDGQTEVLTVVFLRMRQIEDSAQLKRKDSNVRETNEP